MISSPSYVKYLQCFPFLQKDSGQGHILTSLGSQLRAASSLAAPLIGQFAHLQVARVGLSLCLLWGFTLVTMAISAALLLLCSVLCAAALPSRLQIDPPSPRSQRLDPRDRYAKVDLEQPFNFNNKAVYTFWVSWKLCVNWRGVVIV